MNEPLMVGAGWPDPTEPGVPASGLDGGSHWMAWPRTGVLTIGQWSTDIRCWVVSYRGEIVGPEEMAYLDYLGPAQPPSTRARRPPA